MIDEQRFDALLAVLAGIEKQLAVMAESNMTTNPAYQRRLEQYLDYDWSELDAIVLETDEDGVAAVEWRGLRYTRRSPQNKYGAAIWFSRAAGKDEDGTVHYDRLVTFKQQSDPDPLPAKTITSLEGATKLAKVNGDRSEQPAPDTDAPVTPTAPAADGNGSKPEPTDHPTWAKKEDAWDWAQRMGIYGGDYVLIKGSFIQLYNDWGKPDSATMFDRWDTHVRNMLHEDKLQAEAKLQEDEA